MTHVILPAKRDGELGIFPLGRRPGYAIPHALIGECGEELVSTTGISRDQEPLLPYIVIQCGTAENEIAHPIAAVSGEVTQVVVIGPVLNPRWRIELWILAGDRATEETAWTLILQQIREALGQGNHIDTTGGGGLAGVEKEPAARERMEDAEFDGLAVTTDPIERPGGSNRLNLAPQRVTCTPSRTEPHDASFRDQVAQGRVYPGLGLPRGSF